MGWAVGFDENWKRDVGYGVPAVCDHPECDAEIDRGLGHVCGDEPYGGTEGCGLFFCTTHRRNYRAGVLVCERCGRRYPTFDAKPDTKKWLQHKLTDPSWQEWRDQNPDFVKQYEADKSGAEG